LSSQKLGKLGIDADKTCQNSPNYHWTIGVTLKWFLLATDMAQIGSRIQSGHQGRNAGGSTAAKVLTEDEARNL